MKKIDFKVQLAYLCAAVIKFVRRIKKSKKALIVACTALLCAVAATTLAVVFVITDPIKNKFIVPNLDNEIVEKFEENKDGDMEKTSVTVKNVGNVEEFIRVAVVVNWQNESGNVSAKKVADGDFSLEVNDTEWVKNGKYWYYKVSVPKAESTAEFLKSGTKVALTEQGEANVPEGFFLSVEILAEGIQADPVDAIEEAWGFSAEEGAIVFEKGGNE